MRGAAHQHALWRGLKTDDLQVIATDHCPFCFSENVLGLRLSKELGRDDFSKIPNGAPGLETRMPLVYDGGVRNNAMSLNRYVELMATAPAKLFGLFPRKGTIAVGSDADIVLFDPNETWTIRAAEHHSRVEYSLFEGREVTGRVKQGVPPGRADRRRQRNGSAARAAASSSSAARQGRRSRGGSEALARIAFFISLNRRALASRACARGHTTLAWLRALFVPFPSHQIKHLKKNANS